MSKESYSSWCYGRPIGSENKRWSSEQELESKINIITPVDIWQFGFANGGDANGGDGGNAVGGSAAAASSESEGDGDSVAVAVVDIDRPYTGGAATGENQTIVPGRNNAANQALRASQAAAPNQLAQTNGLLDDLDASLDAVLQGEGATAIGGDASGGNGGNGGNANGGTVTNTAVVTTVNVIVISDNEIGTTPDLTIGTGSGKLDISSDESGTFVNGQKMDESTLNDGTKVYIFRNSEVKK